MSDGAPNFCTSFSEYAATVEKMSPRRSRPTRMAILAPKYTAPMAQTAWTNVTTSMKPPRRQIVGMSPLATPSSMMSALMVGRYSEADACTACSAITASSSGV